VIRASSILALLLSLAGCPGPNPVLADGGGDLARAGDSFSCLPNNDGEIEVSELNFKVGLEASYRVNPPGTLVGVDVEGKLVAGRTEWNFSAADGTVMPLRVEAVTSAAWYAKSFPGASFALAGDAADTYVQVFRMESDRLLLLGVASRAQNATLMVYDHPVLSLRFPLRQGDAYSDKARVVDGRLHGLPIATEDSYEVKVDALGAVRLPYLTLAKSLRVQLALVSAAVGGAKTSSRQYQWFHECYGEVARIVSQRDEPSVNFTKAVEFRRLTF
jgi:hypothetical protein